ncbi:MAG: DNA-binding protein [Bacillota bacterium]
MEYITAKEAAAKWGISQRRVQVLCEQNRVDGAKRLGWAWAIPKDAPKPADARLKRENGQEVKIIKRNTRSGGVNQ